MSVRYLEAAVVSGASVHGALRDAAGPGGTHPRGVAGVTEDGRLLALLDVPAGAGAPGAGQASWWASLLSACADDPRIEPTTEVRPFVSNIPAHSDFAQVIRARVTDRATFERVLDADGEWLARERPEILGGTLAWHSPDRFTLVVCLRDETSARAGEAKNAESPGADIERLMHDVSYSELRCPWTGAR